MSLISLEQIKNIIQTLAPKNHSHTFELVGEVEGSDTLTFDTDYSELFIEARYYGTCCVFHVPKECLSSDEKYFINGWMNGRFYICCTETTARMYEIYVDGTTVTDDSVMTVFRK